MPDTRALPVPAALPELLTDTVEEALTQPESDMVAEPCADSVPEGHAVLVLLAVVEADTESVTLPVTHFVGAAEAVVEDVKQADTVTDVVALVEPVDDALLQIVSVGEDVKRAEADGHAVGLGVPLEVEVVEAPGEGVKSGLVEASRVAEREKAALPVTSAEPLMAADTVEEALTLPVSE